MNTQTQFGRIEFTITGERGTVVAEAIVRFGGEDTVGGVFGVRFGR